MKPFLITISLLWFSSSFFGQSAGSIDIPFQFYFHNDRITPGEYYHLPTSMADSIRVDVLKCIISNVAITDLEGNIHRAENTFFLLDLNDPKNCKITFPISRIDQIKSIQFSIGTDSLTNVDGARGGALDPMHGMYWAWHSGYINFKIEGNTSLSLNQDHSFQYHLGGYLSPNETIQHFQFNLNQKGISAIRMDLLKWIDYIDFTEKSEIMTPGPAAHTLAQHLIETITIRP